MKIYQKTLLSAAVSALLIGGPAIGQSSDEEVLEEIVVTGSRIRQNPLEARAPVQLLSEQDLERSGQVSLADFVQKLPISGSAINSANNSSGNLGFPPDGGGIGAGAAEVDLRYLGSKRTLVLVDGRRWIRGSSASGVSGAVDLNTIPANAVKSIEILQDGASAVYGSDAIGGVVNIITQDDWDVFKASAYYSEYTSDGDAQSSEIDIAWGASSDIARAFIDISYTDQGEVNAGDREISSFPVAGAPFGFSSGTPAGRFVFTDPNTGGFINAAPNNVFPVYDPNNPNGAGFHPFTLEDRFNYQPFNFLKTPNERTAIFAKGEYDLTSDVTLNVLATYNNRRSTSRAAPEPLFFGPAGGGGAFMENLFWPADHPFNPFGVDLGPNDIVFLTRRPIEAGPRIFDQTVDTYLLSLGANGAFEMGGGSINWDVTAVWSRNEADQRKQGAFNARNLITALGPPEICAAIPGCTPFNFVGEGSITQEMLDFVTFIQKDNSEQEMFDFTANITGSFGGFEAGDIGWAVGIEHREEDGFFIPDSVVSRGETAGVPASPTNGGFDVDEVYGELVIPLLAGVSGADRLDVSVAGRYSDYDLFDSESIFKVGLNWAPNDEFLVRANFSEGFRAPHIGELFNTGSRFDSAINDRCSNASSADQANCAALGVPAGFVSLNPQVSVTTGGNENLEPETSDTITVGFAWEPTFVDDWDGVDRLGIEFNYYDIEIDGAIQAANAQDTLDLCIDNPGSVFCDAVTRSPDGTITRINGVLQNIGGIETTGYDLGIRLELAETDYGQFTLGYNGTFLDDYIEITQGPDGEIRTDRAGTELGSPERAFFENKSNFTVDWYYGDWDARATFRYLDSLTEACGGSTPDFVAVSGGRYTLDDFCSNAPDTNEIDSAVFTDVQVTWRPSSFDDGKWAFQLGFDNLFDEDIPICRSCDLNSFDGTVYPIPGRIGYLRVSYQN